MELRHKIGGLGFLALFGTQIFWLGMAGNAWGVLAWFLALAFYVLVFMEVAFTRTVAIRGFTNEIFEPEEPEPRPAMSWEQAVATLQGPEADGGNLAEAVAAVYQAVASLVSTSTDGLGEWLAVRPFKGGETPQGLARDWDHVVTYDH